MRWFIEADVSNRKSKIGILNIKPRCYAFLAQLFSIYDLWCGQQHKRVYMFVVVSPPPSSRGPLPLPSFYVPFQCSGLARAVQLLHPTRRNTPSNQQRHHWSKCFINHAPSFEYILSEVASFSPGGTSANPWQLLVTKNIAASLSMAPVNSLVCNTGPNVINNGHYVLCWVCSEALTVATVKSYFGHLPLCDVTLSSFYLVFCYRTKPFFDL